MAYSLDNALFQWREGERRVGDSPEPARADLERAVAAIVDELRKRLGSSFVLDELADRRGAGTDAASVVDAAFARYAREASNYAGGRARERHERP